MAMYVAAGPFDQKLPASLQAGEPHGIGIKDPSAVQKLAAVQVPIEDPTGKISSVYASVEVYPSVGAASARGNAQLDRWETAYGEHDPQGQTVDGFCFEAVVPQNLFICGASRGHAYVETWLRPTPSPYRGVTQAITSSLGDYAANKEKLATE
ncbi:hypothetical protein [Rhodococcus sp. NCIMB 12038]|uniref:hypothetical protein n=1 Tax=Rhodococcus sp. NCIMB 12038 TaxID=933800 RepID=UPI00117A8DB2|nr:hypothetical protein [Rhodococcus sp. NCIMB 12038]